MTHLPHPCFCLSQDLSKSGFSVTVIKTPRQKATWGGNVCFRLYIHIKVCHRRKLRQNLEAGTGVEAMKEHCPLARSSWLAHPAFFYNSGYLPGAGTIIGWATNQENDHTHTPKERCHISLATGQSYERIFLIVVPSSQILACVKLTKTTNQDRVSHSSSLPQTYYVAKTGWLELSVLLPPFPWGMGL